MSYRTSWVNWTAKIQAMARSGATILMTAEQEFRSTFKVLPVPG